MSPNLELVVRVARKVEPVLDEFVFMGGAIVELYLTDPVSDRVRPTVDTDVVCEVTSYSEYHRLGEQLGELSFRQSARDADPVYRWRSRDDVLDVMPRDAAILGFSNPWYESALERKRPIEIDDGLVVYVPEPPTERRGSMKPRITVITLGVDDLEGAVGFYRDGLGLPTEGVVGTEFEHGAVAFFELEHGVKLALYGREDLAHDAQLDQTEPSPTEFSLGHNVGSQGEVDSVMEQAEEAGARIVKPAQSTFWGGYAGYFQDLDGHLWEVAWNPAWDISEQTGDSTMRRGSRE